MVVPQAATSEEHPTIGGGAAPQGHRAGLGRWGRSAWLAAAVAVVASVLGAAALCFLPGTVAEGPASAETAPRLVKVVRVSAMEAERTRSFPGAAKEVKQVQLAFRVGGPLRDFPVALGQQVREGDLIARIDPRDFELQVERLRAGLAEADAQLTAMLRGARAEDVAALQAKLNAVRARRHEAAIHEARMRNLFEQNSVSQAEYDNAQTMLEVAEAELAAHEQELEKALRGARSEEIAAMEAKLAGLKAQLRAAENSLADSELRAPFHGYVAWRHAESFETVAAGQPVVTLLDCSMIEVTVGAPEEMVIRRDRFLRFECEFEAYPGRRFPAELKELGQTVHPGSRSYPLTVRMTPPEDVVVQPGMAATVHAAIAAAEEPVPTVLPAAALISKGEGESSVWVYEPSEGIVRRRGVVLGPVRGDGLEIREGLAPGEWVVAAGAAFLHEGQRVKTDHREPPTER